MFPALTIHFWNANISQANDTWNSGARCLPWCCKHKDCLQEKLPPAAALGLLIWRHPRVPPKAQPALFCGEGSGRLPLLPALAARQYVEGDHRLFSPTALLGRSRGHFSPLCFMDHNSSAKMLEPFGKQL